MTSDTKQSGSLKIPKLRFPGFEGEWEEKSFGEITKLGKEKYNPIIDNNSYKNIELESIESETGTLIKVFDSKEQKSLKTKFNKGDILYGKLRPYLKKFLKAPFDGVVSTEIWVIKNRKISDINFIYYIVQTNKFNQIVNIQSGSKMPRADWSILCSSLFNLPSLPEQQKIADFLGAVDEYITNLKKHKELLEKYKKGMMQKIFSREIRFAGFIGDWEEKKLGEVARFFSGGTPTSTNKKYYSGNIPFIKSGEISSSKTEQFISEDALQSSSAKIVEVGDLLYALYGATSGTIAISKLNGAINQAVLCIRTDENKMWLYNYLNYKKESILAKYLQGGQGNLSADIVKKIKISFPSFPEQQKIADFLSVIDDLIEAKSREIENTEKWKKGLMQGLFV